MNAASSKDARILEKVERTKNQEHGWNNSHQNMGVSLLQDPHFLHALAASEAESLFLFLLPFGRPRGLFTGASTTVLGDSAVARFAPEAEGDTVGAAVSPLPEAPLARRSLRYL